jgi:hypothetical protein
LILNEIANVIYTNHNNSDKKKKKKNSSDGILENFEFLDKPKEKGKFCWSQNSQMFNSINNNVQMTSPQNEPCRSNSKTLVMNENGINSNGTINGNIWISNPIVETSTFSNENFINTPKFNFTNTPNPLFLNKNEITPNNFILNDDIHKNSNNKPSTPLNSTSSILKTIIAPVRSVTAIDRVLSVRNDTFNRQHINISDINATDRDKLPIFTVLQSKSCRSLKNGSVSVYVIYLLY